MVTYCRSQTIADLEGILQLQQLNLRKNLTEEEINTQGFVTVEHTFSQLKGLNDREPHVIALADSRIIGYVLAMTRASQADIPILVPMFKAFEAISFQGKPFSDHHYILCGQACVDKNFRGMGILDGCYRAFRDYYGEKYDFVATEIARTNPRSLRAHERIGFSPIHTYFDPLGTEWMVVVWDWGQR